MHIQWFPGHMNKTRKILAENLKIIDVVIELLDARIPVSSKNPELDRIIGSKLKITAFNKSDLADDAISEKWSKWYKMNGCTNIFIDSVRGKGINELKIKLKDLMKEKILREQQKGRIFRPIRTMVVGIPNVGKSSFINKIAGRACTVTGDKPGITKGKQWIRINEEIELLDTPGILWPKFDDEQVGLNLAFTGAIKDDILDTVEAAGKLMEKLNSTYPRKLSDRYKISLLEGKDGLHLLEDAGKNRGCIISGGNIDFKRIAAIVLDEFRGGKIGKISLEQPEPSPLVPFPNLGEGENK